MQGQYCCRDSCENCGGDNCGLGDDPEGCCGSSIMNSGKYCSTGYAADGTNPDLGLTGAPCIVPDDAGKWTEGRVEAQSIPLNGLM